MFPAFPLSPLSVLDSVVLAALAAGLVIATLVGYWREKALERAGRPSTRMALYWVDGVLVPWGMTLVILAAWAASGRPFTELGLAAPATINFAGGAAAALVLSLALIGQLVAVRLDPKARLAVARQVAGAGGVAKVLPRSRGERRMFLLISATAGVTEEIVFRGFLIWGLAHWTPVWAAALLSLALFTFSHLYQERWSALAGVAAAGATCTVLTIVSGSILPAILLHFVIDWSSGEIAWVSRSEIEAATAGRTPPTSVDGPARPQAQVVRQASTSRSTSSSS
jgi:membrane protease YdiL (CAAX protease family)